MCQGHQFGKVVVVIGPGVPPKAWVRGWVAGLRGRARALKSDTYALYFAARDPRTPWYAKVLAAAVVAYALSPFDLIPDFIPVIGYLDDLIIVPLGIAAVVRMVPPEVMAECRKRARVQNERRASWVGAGLVIVVWLLGVSWVVLFVRGFSSSS